VPSFSNLLTKLTTAGFYYEKSTRHASFNFNQDSNALYRNQPRFPFEYYIDIKINRVGSAGTYFNNFFNNASWTQVQPLVKSIEMPAFKIQTDALNQYNRKRISQTRIDFESVKMVFHDVADGKTLKFWEMYYRYYFQDGNEPGKNQLKQTNAPSTPITVESLVNKVTSSVTNTIDNAVGKVTSTIDAVTSKVTNFLDNPLNSILGGPTNDSGSKDKIENIVQNTLDNHKFGFALPTVQNVRNLISSIDIYQVHGGRFNQVTLVNPRIAAFNHDLLNYATTDKTLELTFVIEYEYAYYTIQNLKLGGGESNNSSSMEPFEHGEFLDLPALAFNTTLLDFIESNNPLLNSDSPLVQRVGKNLQSSLGSLAGAYESKIFRRVTSSALDGLANISPLPTFPTSEPNIVTRPFASVPTKTISAEDIGLFNASSSSSNVAYSQSYLDLNRSASNG
jgi:hypothetical protein